MRLAFLALLGVVEAVVWLYRCRTANAASAWRSAVAAFWTTTTRLAFLWVGASAVLASTPWWAALGAYVIPATIGTFLAHKRLERP